MYIWSYCSQVVVCFFIADIACTYDLTNLAWNLLVSLVVDEESSQATYQKFLEFCW